MTWLIYCVCKKQRLWQDFRQASHELAQSLDFLELYHVCPKLVNFMHLCLPSPWTYLKMKKCPPFQMMPSENYTQKNLNNIDVKDTDFHIKNLSNRKIAVILN